MRIRLRTLLGLVLGIALALAFYASYVHIPPWHRAGGMIGWSQATIEAKLGPPAQVFEYDLPHPHALSIRPGPPGTYRTLVFSGLHGHFIAWMKAEAGGYTCLRSSWAEKGTYY